MGRLTVGIMGTLVVLAATGRATAAPKAPAAPGTNAAPEARATVSRYCVSCHNQRLKTAQFVLEGLDPAEPASHAGDWEKVIRKLRAGVMPPAGAPRPEPAVLARLAGLLEDALDVAAVQSPNPGRPAAVHRLNRSEYRNAVRDLLGLDIDVAAMLPPDSGSFGFDNVGDVLGLSPLLLERYLAAARRISAVALGSASLTPTTDTFRVPSDLTQDTRLPNQPFGTRGGLAIPYMFPQDGDYDVRIRLARESVTDAIAGLKGRHDIEVSLDGERVRVFTLVDGRLQTTDGTLADVSATADPRRPGSRRDAGFYGDDVARVADEPLRLRFPVKAGSHILRVAFPRHSAVEIESIRQPFLRAAPENGDSHGAPYLSSVAISGPFNGRAGGDTPSRRRILVCQPSGRSDDLRCARQILATLARRAYRRPVSAVDVDDLLTFFNQGRANGGFDAGIELALVRVLVGPSFLFRTEFDPPKATPNGVYPINDIELASRLSFFLWSSIPDDEVLRLAEQGRLRDTAVLTAQVRRMLADPKASALIENFAGQWLYLRNVPHVLPDRQLFPDFDENLRQAFRQETELFFGSILRENRPALELLTADYTFLNERLARHYGIPGVYGDRFRRVPLPDGPRGGLLGHGSILTVRSYANRTSPVLRGVWILENVLGAPPPPPPPNVPALKDTNSDGKVLSMRERMVQHRRNPACAACHGRMDPLGLPMEEFDAIGRVRVQGEGRERLDLSGALPDGTTFDGVAGLRQALVKHGGEFVTTLTEKLMTYALGRGLDPADAPAIRQVVRDAAPAEHRLAALILGIVKSTPFQMRRAGQSPLVAEAQAR